MQAHRSWVQAELLSSASTQCLGKQDDDLNLLLIQCVRRNGGTDEWRACCPGRRKYAFKFFLDEEECKRERHYTIMAKSPFVIQVRLAYK
jgi:hypothetical protein